MHSHYKQSDSEPQIDRSKLVLYIMQFCPFSRRVACYLDHLGVEHTRVHINLSEKPAWFKIINPTTKTPFIEYGGQKMGDSEMICRFLSDNSSAAEQNTGESGAAAAAGGGGGGGEAAGSGETVPPTHETLYFEWMKGWWPRIFPVFHRIAFEPDVELGSADAEAFQSAINSFEKICEGPFISGDSPGLTDFMIFPLLDYYELCVEFLPSLQEALKVSQKTAKWLESMRALPALSVCDGRNRLSLSLQKQFRVGGCAILSSNSDA